MSESLSARTVRISGHGGIPDQRLIGDVGGAAAYLREPPTSNGKVGVIGTARAGGKACSPPATWTWLLGLFGKQDSSPTRTRWPSWTGS